MKFLRAKIVSKTETNTETKSLGIYLAVGCSPLLLYLFLEVYSRQQTADSFLFTRITCRKPSKPHLQAESFLEEGL